MAGRSVPQKWRPTLAMIVFAVLLTVLVLPALIVVWFRYLEHTSELRPIEIGALAVALVITVVIAVVFLRTITGPINALVKRAEEIGRGGRAAIVSPEQLGTREIATLSQSFLDLAERLVDRTEYVSSFAAHVSHELKSPITSIRGSAELLRDAEMSKQERDRFLDHIIADADRLAALLERLRELARADLDAAPGSTTVADAVSGQALAAVSGEVTARIAAEFYPLTGEVAARPGVQKLFFRLTVLWAAICATRAGVTLWLLHTLSVSSFVTAKTAYGPGSAVLGAALTIVLAVRVARREGLLPGSPAGALAIGAAA